MDCGLTMYPVEKAREIASPPVARRNRTKADRKFDRKLEARQKLKDFDFNSLFGFLEESGKNDPDPLTAGELTLEQIKEKQEYDELFPKAPSPMIDTMQCEEIVFDAKERAKTTNAAGQPILPPLEHYTIGEINTCHCKFCKPRTDLKNAEIVFRKIFEAGLCRCSYCSVNPRRLVPQQDKREGDYRNCESCNRAHERFLVVDEKQTTFVEMSFHANYEPNGAILMEWLEKELLGMDFYPPGHALAGASMDGWWRQSAKHHRLEAWFLKFDNYLHRVYTAKVKSLKAANQATG